MVPVATGIADYSYDHADRITAAGSTGYTVDANGNTTVRGGDNFAYDQANRLKTATVGGTTTTYVYDGDGKRTSATVGTNSPITYAYDVGRSLATLLSDGSRKYVYGVGLAYTVDNSNAVQVYHTDALGSVRAMTDATGALVQTFQTDAFGVATVTQGTSTQLFGFTGEQRDSDGLMYLRARYYDPVASRFLSRDSMPGYLVAPLSLNRYTYVQNNPINQTDPSGMAAGDGSSIWSKVWDAVKQGISQAIDDSFCNKPMSLAGCPRGPITVTNGGAPVKILLPGDLYDASTAKASMSGASPSGGNGRQTVRLWRAVEKDELADIQRYGDYGIHPNSTFKRFAFSEADIDTFIRANPTREYTKTYIDIPADKLNLMDVPYVDTGGAGYTVGIDVYDHPEFYEWFDDIHIVP
jgi:RHS repeat-associated protein